MRVPLFGSRKRTGAEPSSGRSFQYLVTGELVADARMDLLQGTLDVLVLRALTLGPMHGYAASRWIGDRTRGVITVEYAPLYKALHRLEHDDCVSGSWGVSENGRRARYYRLTPRGRSRLKSEDADWRRYAAAIFQVLDPA